MDTSRKKSSRTVSSELIFLRDVNLLSVLRASMFPKVSSVTRRRGLVHKPRALDYANAPEATPNNCQVSSAEAPNKKQTAASSLRGALATKQSRGSGTSISALRYATAGQRGGRPIASRHASLAVAMTGQAWIFAGATPRFHARGQAVGRSQIVMTESRSADTGPAPALAEPQKAA